MAQNHYLAGVGTALLFKGNDLIGVAKTLTESTFNFAITAEDIRGGKGNGLLGRYFHDSTLTATLTDAMFDLNYIALSLGVNVESGGLSVKEEELKVGADNTVTTTETPVAFDGTMIGWYKKPTDTDWTIGTIAGNKMTITGGAQEAVYCVKYFYQNANAKSITIKSQYVPATLHVVVLTDLYSGKVGTQSDATRYGRLIIDIPQFQLDGSQDLSLTATSAATVSLSGQALAVLDGATCEDDPYYGTMTEEIYGAKWQDDVIALAIENADIDLAKNGTEALIVRAVYGKGMASQRKDNSNFTFTKVASPAATATGVTVSTDGVVSAGTVDGAAVIEVTLKNAPDVPPAFATVTVTA
nr:MAG TPA_asm: structural protein [Caudoviricetes sp.]